jgi:hypothetical protein
MRGPSKRLSLRRLVVPATVVMIIFVALAGGRRWQRFRAKDFDWTRNKSLRTDSPPDDSSAAGVPRARATYPNRLGARMIEDKYRIRVTSKDQEYPVKTFHGLIQATNAEAASVDDYCELLAQEFMLYPPSLIKLCLLKRIVLCRGLAFNGQARAALPDFEHSTLYFDVVRGGFSRRYQRLVIHHEFFHLIDYQDDGEVYSDARWARLNAETFRYAGGGATMQGDHLSGLPSNIPGFLTRYATSGVEEDKAELFAYMMTEYAVVGKRAAADRVIYEKISQMKALMVKFCPDMDETFWDKVSRR